MEKAILENLIELNTKFDTRFDEMNNKIEEVKVELREFKRETNLNFRGVGNAFGRLELAITRSNRESKSRIERRNRRIKKQYKRWRSVFSVIIKL